jgi:glutaredoxin-dependent peroxiredoxin
MGGVHPQVSSAAKLHARRRSAGKAYISDGLRRPIHESAIFESRRRMLLYTGVPAPDFTLFTSEREPWTLSEHRDRPVLLLFFPGAFTSVCTDELVTVSNRIDEYDALEARVVGISTDSPAVLKEYAKVNLLKMTLVSDHDADVAAAYGTKHDRDFGKMKLDRVARRAAFVIDREGIVRYAEVLRDAENQPDFENVQTVLRELRDRSSALTTV